MIKKIGEVDLERVLLEIEAIPSFERDQIMLQTVKGCDDPYYGIGKSTDLKHKERDFVEPLYNMPYLNSVFKKLKWARTRVMKVKPYHNYSWHYDGTCRSHIPVITNEHNFFIIEDGVYKMPADGGIYIADTTKYHTFVNASMEDRIHIVGASPQVTID